jgi:hypothetical protein
MEQKDIQEERVDSKIGVAGTMQPSAAQKLK